MGIDKKKTNREITKNQLLMLYGLTAMRDEVRKKSNISKEL